MITELFQLIPLESILLLFICNVSLLSHNIGISVTVSYALWKGEGEDWSQKLLRTQCIITKLGNFKYTWNKEMNCELHINAKFKIKLA